MRRGIWWDEKGLMAEPEDSDVVELDVMGICSADLFSSAICQEGGTGFAGKT
jgi:hypothetical protein